MATLWAAGAMTAAALDIALSQNTGYFLQSWNRRPLCALVNCIADGKMSCIARQWCRRITTCQSKRNRALNSGAGTYID